MTNQKRRELAQILAANHKCSLEQAYQKLACLDKEKAFIDAAKAKAQKSAPR